MSTEQELNVHRICSLRTPPLPFLVNALVFEVSLRQNMRVKRDFLGPSYRESTWYFPNIGGPQCRPQNTSILISVTPKTVPLIL